MELRQQRREPRRSREGETAARRPLTISRASELCAREGQTAAPESPEMAVVRVWANGGLLVAPQAGSQPSGVRPAVRAERGPAGSGVAAASSASGLQSFRSSEGFWR